MRLYRYYRKDALTKEEALAKGVRADLNSRYPLAACTSNKKYAKAFEEERNMDMYFKFSTKYDEDDEEDVTKFLLRHRGKIIEPRELQTTKKSHTSKRTRDSVTLHITQDEMYEVEENRYMMDPSFWIDLPPASIFKDNFRDALNTIEYDRQRRLMSSGTYGAYIDTEYAEPTYENNELNIFIGLFGKYLNPEI